MDREVADQNSREVDSNFRLTGSCPPLPSPARGDSDNMKSDQITSRRVLMHASASCNVVRSYT